MATQTAARDSARTTANRLEAAFPKAHLPITGLLALAAIAIVLALPQLAAAGSSSTGELVLYPCTRCHPTGDKPASSRPNRFKGHRIKLEAHNVLGKGSAACLVCHDSPDRNPGKLRLIDGTLVDIKGNVSLVCFRCHADKYTAWKAGFHGKKPSCTAVGCHNPHSPSWIGITPLLPYVGTTIEIKAVGEREPFEALPGPPAQPEPPTFASMNLLALLGVIGIAAVWTVPFVQRRRRHNGRPS